MYTIVVGHECTSDTCTYLKVPEFVVSLVIDTSDILVTRFEYDHFEH